MITNWKWSDVLVGEGGPIRRVTDVIDQTGWSASDSHVTVCAEQSNGLLWKGVGDSVRGVRISMKQLTSSLRRKVLNEFISKSRMEKKSRPPQCLSRVIKYCRFLILILYLFRLIELTVEASLDIISIVNKLKVTIASKYVYSKSRTG